MLRAHVLIIFRQTISLERNLMSKISKINTTEINSPAANISGSNSSVSVYLAKAGICARRKAGDLVKAGQVTVNDQVILEPGYKLKVGDIVKYLGNIINFDQKVYLLLNKPAGYITTVSDDLKRPTIFDLLDNSFKARLYPVGRLDRETTGLLVLTNDGDLAQRLAHPKYEIAKTYCVTVDRDFAEADFITLKTGLELTDGFIKPDLLEFKNLKDRKKLLVEIHSGRNRIVRRMFQALDYTVRKLERVQYAGLTLTDLKSGTWRYLTEIEISGLK